MDPRKILGVGPDATKEEIQRAYREKVRKHHPDMGGDAWAFQQVREAYEALTNPKPDPAPESKPRPPQARPAPPKPAKQKPDRPKPAQSNPSGPRQQSSFSQATGRKPKSRSTTYSKKRAAKPKKKTKNPSQKFEDRKWWQLFTSELPLQSETAVFILINCLDIFFTHKLLSKGAIEANPIANYFYRIWNFNGMIVFKLSIVAFVCVIAQIIAFKRIKTAKGLLYAGSLIVGCVVVYSFWLYMTRFR